MIGSLVSIDYHPPAEEPVPRVLTVGLSDVEALDVGGVAPHLFGKKVRVVIEVPIVEGQPHLPVEALERRAPLLEDGHLSHRFGLDAGRETGEWLQVPVLRHAIVHLGQERRDLFIVQSRRASQQVAARALDAADLL